ncbi:MAG: hypothetical protein IJ282_08335 [Lachnospiraceae bacterium]|nr:hypothetical protein [Lachnospiraceae bacterium]
MLVLDFCNAGINAKIEIEKGVGWKFCELSWRFRNYAFDAYFKDGEFVITSEWITFRALDDRNTIYEVKLSAVEEGKINIYEDAVKTMKKKPYTETIQREIDRSSDILRFYLTVTYEPGYVEKSRRGSFPWKTDSCVRTMTLDKEVTFDFCNDPFMKVMKKIMDYCERKNEKLSVSLREYMLPGHCVDIPHTVVGSENFEIVFEFENVREVYVGENIMNSSYYTDSLGDEYYIGNIVREMQKKTQRHTYMTGYGASNMWKIVFPENSIYIFSCGFSL